MSRLKANRYSKEIWLQLSPKYNPEFLEELLEGIEARPEPSALMDYVTAMARTWRYDPEELLKDLIPRSWLAGQ